MKIFKNQWANIIFIVLILVLIIPQTRKPIQIFVNKVLSFSPSETSEEDREQIAHYNWSLQSTQGERVEFSEYEGEIIIINYWATWCPPCIAEMPSFQELYEDYNDRVAFFFISGEEHEKTTSFLNSKGLSLPSYRMLTQDPKPLEGYTLPTTYVIDKYGNIVINKRGAADWNSLSFRKTLDRLLAE